MKCAHLFNGIGGFALAAHWMNWENIMHCEIDPFCNKVMNYHFPKSIQHEDIRTTDFTIYRGKIDLVTGGFPCQPYSTAGKRKGKEDDRHLWPQMLRAVREIQPGWIVGENVRGLTNWNGGLVFDEVQADLEAEGYEVLPFLLPAAGVNAPHRRDRIWFVAHRNNRQRKHEEGEVQAGRNAIDNISNERPSTNANDIYGREGTGGEDRAQVGNSYYRLTTNTNCCQRCEGRMHEERSEKAAGHTCSCNTWYDRTDWQNFPTQSPVCNRNDGIPDGLADITFSKWRKESIKALGNAIVPQVAYQIFKAIELYESNSKKVIA